MDGFSLTSTETVNEDIEMIRFWCLRSPDHQSVKISFSGAISSEQLDGFCPNVQSNIQFVSIPIVD